MQIKIPLRWQLRGKNQKFCVFFSDYQQFYRHHPKVEAPSNPLRLYPTVAMNLRD
ncbi:hypothetical protein B6N60_01686 [Richelia sinica FACHB-800]|uniref:Uncharacterized protein n=1 Tax=Richelia sinica FACHB-800 TaxID=1357546 RepID=A0A975T6A3_9NOST|nr:hypothetical protein B6N60_01686 [Richelia sinica FACHB-800]